MLKSLFILPICLVTTLNATHITKMSSEVTVHDAELPRNEPLHLQGVKKICKGLIEHITLINCKGVIDEATFKHFPKLSELTIWTSNIEAISTILPINRMVVIGSHFPNLDADLQQKLPKLQALLLLAINNFEVYPSVIKNFKHLQVLHVSKASFTEDCVTKDWFRGMDLQELGLSDNGIDCIFDDAFNGLKGLRKLDLTFNHIPNVDGKIFKKLTKLEKLGLYENDIEYLNLGSLASQKVHLQQIGISWRVLQYSNISADDLLKALPNLKSVSFGHQEMPNDFKAGEFCQILRQKGVNCEIDIVFGISKLLGYYM